MEFIVRCVKVIECDAEIQRVYDYKGHLPKNSGGRGTDFDPVFAFLRSNRLVNHDACIYLTDGHSGELKYALRPLFGL